MSKEDDLERVLETIADDVELTHARSGGKIVVVFGFSEPGFGFGEVTLVQTPEGLFMDGEHMSSERIKRYLCKLVDKAVRELDKDPARHALYNKNMGRSCSDSCEVCHPTKGEEST